MYGRGMGHVCDVTGSEFFASSIGLHGRWSLLSSPRSVDGFTAQLIPFVSRLAGSRVVLVACGCGNALGRLFLLSRRGSAAPSCQQNVIRVERSALAKSYGR